MNKPISNPILTIQNRKVTDFSTFDKKPPGPFVFKKIADGENKGFYYGTSVINGAKIIVQGKQEAYTKAYFEPTKQPKYLYRDYVPFYDGFYYIPKSEIPIKKLIYGLQNYDLPTSGNIETYIKSFDKISVPVDFCPLIDPCVYDWCQPCEQQRIQNAKQYALQPRKGRTFINYLCLASMLCFVALIVTISLGW